uniref:Ribosome inactivating type 1 protein n=1 Tax=Iris hollandica TaxID=35876 RepID=UPI00020F0527|nr:Chain A, Ribosome inactivating type 1 protein [Iris x hollandica]3MVG_B Chain B, Ribosome inactivating type 1 protein [Iris x hollandica]
IETVEFRVTGTTRRSYSDFLQNLRNRLSSGTSVHDIPLLPAQSGSQQDLLFVRLFDWGNRPITLVLNRVNAYVVAYQAQNRFYLLSDTPANPQVYGNNPHRLTFTGSYGALQNVAKSNRENIDLGINPLATAITTLHNWSPPTVETSVARSLIVLIQLVSETARFRAIEQRVTNNIIDQVTPIRYDNFRPRVGIIDLQTNWQTLSTEVQRAEGGRFLQPVKLQVSVQQTVVISDVEKARTFCGLALLLRWRPSQASLSSHDFAWRDIRSILDIGA